MIRIAARILIRFLTLPIAVFFVLVSSQLSVVSGPIFAAEALPPAPAPCTNAKDTYLLTYNFITTDTGEAPFSFTTEQTGIPTDSFRISVTNTFQIDFSKLQAIFGPTNSDYQDGKTQEQTRQEANVIGLEGQDLNQFNGPIQKITPFSKLDADKVKFVEYVAANPHLLESDDKYTDKEGQGPKTIYELVQAFDFPQPPKAGEDKSDWNEKWGKYWAKIPTAYREFYKGNVAFRAYKGNKTFDKLKNGVVGQCPAPKILRTVEFVMPEFSRTMGTSDQLNNVIVPCTAQSYKHIDSVNGECGTTQIAAQNQKDEKGNILSNALKFCKQLVTDIPKGVAEKIKKTVKISFNLLNPIKSASAAEPSPTPIPCFNVMTEGKEGNAPFCAVAQNQLIPGDSCSNPNPSNPNLLNPGPNGNNVLCTLVVSGEVTLTIPTDLSAENPEWDSCSPNSDGTITCKSTIRVFPVIAIPFLSEIWNSTYYSDENERDTGSTQKTGRPGVYTNFMPQAVSQVLFEGDGLITRDRYEELSRRCQGGGPDSGDELVDNPACVELAEALEALEAAFPEIAAQEGGCDYSTPIQLKRCFGPYWGRITSRSLPGQVADNVQGAKDSKVLGVNSGDEKERFIGATDCSKSFTKDIALKPKALQEHIGISEQDCEMNAASNTGTQPGGDDGGGPPGGGGIIIVNPDLDEIFNRAAQLSGVPVAMIKAIARVEGGRIFTYTKEEIELFTTPNWWVTATPEQITRGLAYNTCADPSAGCAPGADVRGAMQFELNTWNNYVPILESILGRPVDRRNLLDNIIGAAFHIRELSGYPGPVTPPDWPEEVVKGVASAYCGYDYTDGPPWPTACTASGIPHHELTWGYYLEYKNQ